MKNIINKVILIIGLLINCLVFKYCVEPFSPEIDRYEDILVVDGLLTNDSIPPFVRLSRSLSYASKENITESKALVVIIDDEGKEIPLEETGKGFYQAGADEIAGKAGHQYKLKIQTKDGKVYESEFESLKEVPDIDSIYYCYEEHSSNSGDELRKGLQIYLDTHDANNNTWYYRWEWEETWEIEVPYPSGSLLVNNEIVPRREQVARCWVGERSRNILIASSDNLNEDVIQQFPLQYVNTLSNKLFFRYSILVKQYALSQETYHYWQQLQDMNENLGTLFDQQPTQVIGNVKNVDDPEEPVLGYFEVASVKKDRIFIERNELPPGTAVAYGFDGCFESQILVDRNLDSLKTYLAKGYFFIGYDANEAGDPKYALNKNKACTDCTVVGTNRKPSFW